jgi:hypothetical protein
MRWPVPVLQQHFFNEISLLLIFWPAGRCSSLYRRIKFLTARIMTTVNLFSGSLQGQQAWVDGFPGCLRKHWHAHGRAQVRSRFSSKKGL